MTNEINESRSQTSNKTIPSFLHFPHSQTIDNNNNNRITFAQETKNKRNPTNRIIVQYILPINPIQYPRIVHVKKYPSTPLFALRIETILLTGHLVTFMCVCQPYHFSHHSLFHYTTTSIFISIKRCLGKLFKSFFPVGNPTPKKKSSKNRFNQTPFFFYTRRPEKK